MLAKPIALLGGTFDPVHLGHLRVAWEAAEFLGAQVRLMPSHVPPHRPAPVASAAQRLALLRAALEGQDRLVVDERELRRQGPSYSVDTLRELRAEVGERQSLMLLVGSDAFAGLTSWHAWRELFALAHIGVLTRPGPAAVLPPELSALAKSLHCVDVDKVRLQPAGCVIPIAVTPLQISATAIRAELSTGRVPRYLLAEPVLQRILSEGWYR